MSKTYLTATQVADLADDAIRRASVPDSAGSIKLYAIPRGGVPAAYAIASAIHRHTGFGVRFVETPGHADYIVDDLIDSGATMKRVLAEAGKNNMEGEVAKPLVLIDKTNESSIYRKKWIVFPWERDELGHDESLEDNVRRMLQFIGEKPERGGLEETPKRVAAAWEFWASGYGRDPADVLKTFEDGAENCDEMVMVKDIPFFTHCEHHMAPFFGTATIAYIPDGKIVGLSKLNRVLDLFARRLQVQERLTTQVADAIAEYLEPRGVGVVLKARHLCMESRGVCQQGHHTVTSALRGVMKDDPTVRAEFLALAR